MATPRILNRLHQANAISDEEFVAILTEAGWNYEDAHDALMVSHHDRGHTDWTLPRDSDQAAEDKPTANTRRRASYKGKVPTLTGHPLDEEQ